MEILDEFVKTLRNFKIQNSIIVEPTIKIDLIKDDLDDNKFLEAGVTGKVDLIISQDKHLLKLKEYGGMKLISPEKALEFI